MKREIIRIDEGKCDSCGRCVTACAQGAIAIIRQTDRRQFSTPA